MVVGEGLVMMTESRWASNAKANKELGRTLRYPSGRHAMARRRRTACTLCVPSSLSG